MIKLTGLAKKRDNVEIKAPRADSTPPEPVVKPKDLVEGLQGQLPPSELPAEAATTVVDPETGFESPISEQDLIADQNEQNRLEGIDISTVTLGTPEQIQETVNTRLAELDATRKKTRQTDQIQKLGVIDAENASVRAARTAEWVFDDDNIITYNDGESSSSATFGQLVDTALGSQGRPELKGMALNLGAAAVLSDPAMLALDKMSSLVPYEEQGKDGLSLAGFRSLEDIREEAASKEGAFQSVAEAKGEIFKDNPNDYSFIDAAARQITQIAREASGVNKNEPDDKRFDSTIGEQVLQHMIDNGEAIIAVHEDHLGNKKYFPTFTTQGREKFHTANSILDTLIPIRTQQKLSRTVPISYGQSKYDTEITVKNAKKNWAEGDIQAINALNRVALVGDNYTFNVVEKLYELATNGEPNALAYFGADEDSLASSRAKALSNFIAQKHPEPELEADRTVNKIKQQKLSDAKRNIDMLKQGVMADGKPRYGDYTIGSNHRFINRASDTNFENKDVIRASLMFADRHAIRFHSENATADYRKHALDLKNILYRNGRARGKAALDDFYKLPEMVRAEMGQHQIYAKAWINLTTKEGQTYESFDGKTRVLNVKRMDPADLLKFFADNHVKIMSDLKGLAQKFDMWINSEQATTAGIPRMFEKVLERGEMPWYVSMFNDVLQEASNDGGNRDRTFQPTAREEKDSNNSNVAIQSLKNGNIHGASTLGFDIDPNDSDAWFTNPDSFYTILWDTVRNQSLRNVIKDPNLRLKMSQYLDTVASGKEWTRQMLVSGFYGLHPSVNRGAVRDLLASDVKGTEMLTEAFGSIENAMDVLLGIRGDAYRIVLADKSVSKFAKEVSSIVALDGKYDFTAITDLGAQVKFGVGVLQPEYQQNVIYDEVTGGKLEAPTFAYYETPDGGIVPLAAKQDRIDYEVQRTTVDGENIKDISKLPGIALGDSISAMLTHAVDASLEKMSILLQQAANTKTVEGEGVSAKGIKNVPIHDANVNDGSGNIAHWISYNMVSVPSMAVEGDTFDQLYNTAHDVLKKLERKGLENEFVDVGVGPQGEHRALFGIFDYHNNLLEGHETKPGLDSDYMERSKRKRLAILDAAKRIGWLPASEYSKEERRSVKIKGRDFIKLVNFAAQIQNVLPSSFDRNNLSPNQQRLTDWANARKKTFNAINRGLYRANTHN